MSNLDVTIRGQQGKDVAESVPRDETHEAANPSDSDPQSARAREAAKDHPIGDPAKGQDEVLAANEASVGHDDDSKAHAREKGPLAQKDRSRLGG